MIPPGSDTSASATGQPGPPIMFHPKAISITQAAYGLAGLAAVSSAAAMFYLFTTVNETKEEAELLVGAGRAALQSGYADKSVEYLFRAIGLDPDLIGLRGTTVTPEDPLAFASGLDGSPVIEAILRDDRAPVVWRFETGQTALLNLSDAPLEVDGPGGTELLSGESADPGTIALEPWQGQIWVPR